MSGARACRTRGGRTTGPCLPSPPCAGLCASGSLSRVTSLPPPTALYKEQVITLAQRWDVHFLKATTKPVSGRMEI